MKLAIRAALAAATLAASFQAAADTITFDDLSDNGGGTPIQSGYAGFIWTRLDVVNTTLAQGPSGYQLGAVSGTNAVYNPFGSPAEIYSSSFTPFTFVGAYFTAAWNDGLTITAWGLDNNGTVVDETSFVVNAHGPTLETFNWSNVTELEFVGSGGTPGYSQDGASGTQFLMDDVTLEPVPLPGAAWLLFSGLSGMGLWGLRRKPLGAAAAF